MDCTLLGNYKGEMMDDFSTSKSGDKLWSPMFGWGEVIDITSACITILSSSNHETYFNLNGSYFKNGPQCLFYDEVKIIPPSKPKEKKVVVIDGVTWLDRGMGSVIFPIGYINENLVVWKDFTNKPPMKMTLEWSE